MQDTREQRHFWWFMVFALVVIGAGLGLRAPWPADEPRFVLVAKQMWESGNWLFPHRGQELYADKPPLFFWIIAATYSIVRNWNIAFLLPSLLVALGTLALTYDFARRAWNRQAGLWAAAAVLCALQFVYQAKRAQIDPTLVFFTTLSMYGIGRHVLLGPHWRWFWLACFAAGLGVISKGVGFLPLLSLLPYAVMRWRGWTGLSQPVPRGAGRWAVGATSFLLAIALWFVPMLITALASGNPEHRAYLDDLLFRQTATRYVNAWHHQEPVWYFIEVIALFWLPFSIFIPWLLRPWHDAWRARDARVVWPLAWGVIVLVFFSASPGKRDMYVLPALPGLAWAAAPFLASLSQRTGIRRALWGFAVLLGGLLLIAGILSIAGNPAFEVKLEAERGLAGDAQADLLWWVLALMGGLIVIGAVALRVHRAVALTLMTVLVVWCGYGLGIAPLLDGENSARDVMTDARRWAGDREIGLVDWKEQQLLQAVGPVTEFGFKAPPELQWQRGLAWMRAKPAQRVLMAQDATLATCIDRTRAQPIGAANRRSWWLVDARAAANCAH